MIATTTTMAATAITPYLAVTVATRILVGPSAPPIIDVLASPILPTLFMTICSQTTLITIWIRENKAKAPTAIKIALHTLRRVSLRFANCSFSTSSLAAMALRSGLSSASTVSPKRTLTVVSSSAAMRSSISESGTEEPCSHFEIVCLTTLSLTANSSCDSPLALRSFLKLSQSIKAPPLFDAIIQEWAYPCKQQALTFPQQR